MPCPTPGRLRLPRRDPESRASARCRTRRAARVRAYPLGRCARRYGRLRRQGLLAGHQARRRQRGVQAQRRLRQLAGRRDPDVAAGDDPRRDRSAEGCPAEHGRAAAHPAAQDHLPRLHPTGRRTTGGRTATTRPEDRRRPPRPRAPATSSSRCRANCRCRPSPDCWACRRRTATSCSAGPTR